MIDYNALEKNIKGTFLKFSDGPVEGEFVGITVEPNPFKKAPTDPDQILRYTFLIDGKEKSLASGSNRLFSAFRREKVKEGDVIRVTRHGLGRDTDYEVEKLEEEK